MPVSRHSSTAYEGSEPIRDHQACSGYPNAIQYAPTRGIVRRTYQKQTALILQVINETNQVSTLQYGEDAPSFK
jgi:hypothetical protein